MDGGKLSIEKDPCTLESKASLKCMDDNNYNRSLCQKYFENYQACKKFWGSVYTARKRAGIVPYLAPVNERDGIKRRYIETGKVHPTPDPETGNSS